MTERVWNQCTECDTVFVELAKSDTFSDPDVDESIECGCGRRYNVEKFEGGAALVRIMSDEDRNAFVRDAVLDSITDVDGIPHSHAVLVSAVKVPEGMLSCVTIVTPDDRPVPLANMHTRAATVLVVLRARGDIDDWSLVIK